MRAADFATLVRTSLTMLAVYMVLARSYPYLIVILIAAALSLDAVDGFLAVWEESGGSVGLGTYIRSALGKEYAATYVKRYKQRIASHAPHGARMDVAGDRVFEYSFWALFTYLKIVPLFVFLIMIIRHSFADALMGSKGTSSRMRSGFARAVYASAIGRGGINMIKFAAFSYLSLVYTLNYPITIGYVLTAILALYILLRGIAEVYESLR